MTSINVILKNSAFRNRVRLYTFQNLEYIDVVPFLIECKNIFLTQAQQVLHDLASLKVNATLEVQFKRTIVQDVNSERNENDVNNPQICTFYLQSPMKEITPTTRISEWFDSNIANQLISRIEEIESMGSGTA